METTYVTSFNDLTNQEAAVAGGILGAMLTTFLVIGLIISITTFIAWWKIFEKAGEKGWKAIIPIYNLYILFKICGVKSWFWCVLCILVVASIITSVNTPLELSDPAFQNNPDYSLINWANYPGYVIGIVVTMITYLVTDIIIAVKLAKAFGKGLAYVLGLIFIPYIVEMVLGFGSAKYSTKNLK